MTRVTPFPLRVKQECPDQVISMTEADESYPVRGLLVHRWHEGEARRERLTVDGHVVNLAVGVG